MKKILWLIVGLFLVVGCGNKEDKSKNENSKQSYSVNFKDKASDEYLFGSPKNFEPNLPFDTITKIKKVLEKNYNQFIFYTLIDGNRLYYVTKGTGKFDLWDLNFNAKKDYKVGVLNQNFKEIIPVEFDKVFNPNDIIDNAIVVQINNKFGIYSLDGKVILNPIYDNIYPSFHEEVMVQVKKDGKFGWIDKDGKENFDDNSQYAVSPMASDLILKWKAFRKNIAFLRTPVESDEYNEFTNSGTLFTPCYIFGMGIMSEYFPSVVMDKNTEYYMGSDSISAKILEKKTFGDKVVGFVSDFFEQGVDARGYQMDQQNLVIVNDKLDTVSTLIVSYGSNYGDYCFEPFYNFFGDTLVEVVKQVNWDFENHTLPLYEFYKIENNGQIKQLTTTRSFAYTKFVKIDESYFKGCYYKNIPEDANYENNIMVYEYLTLEDLDLMRNEIFAEYGMKFKTDKWKMYFQKYDWYKPTYDNVDNRLTEIDKYNLKIILEISEKLKTDEDKYTKKHKATYYQAG